MAGCGAWICCIPGPPASSPESAHREGACSLGDHTLLHHAKAALGSHQAQGADPPKRDRASKGSLTTCVSPNLEALSHPGLPGSSQLCDLVVFALCGRQTHLSFKSSPTRKMPYLAWGNDDSLCPAVGGWVGGWRTESHQEKEKKDRNEAGFRGGGVE